VEGILQIFWILVYKEAQITIFVIWASFCLKKGGVMLKNMTQILLQEFARSQNLARARLMEIFSNLHVSSEGEVFDFSHMEIGQCYPISIEDHFSVSNQTFLIKVEIVVQISVEGDIIFYWKEKHFFLSYREDINKSVEDLFTFIEKSCPIQKFLIVE